MFFGELDDLQRFPEGDGRAYGDQQIAVDGVIERRGEGITFGDNQAIERQAYEQHAGGSKQLSDYQRALDLGQFSLQLSLHNASFEGKV